MKETRILIVEDSPNDVVFIEQTLKSDKICFTSKVVNTRGEYEKQLREFLPEIIICDHSMPQFSSIEALELYKSFKKSHSLTAAFILVTGSVSEEVAVQALRQGAYDYILKNRLIRLPSVVRNALEKNRLKAEQKRVRKENLHLLNIFKKGLNEIYLVDPETLKITYANENALKNIGYSEEEIKELTPTDLLDDFDAEAFVKVVQNVRRSEKGRIYKGNAIRKDGSGYPVQLHLQLVEQEGERNFLVNVLDMTEERKIQEQKELAVHIEEHFSEGNSLQKSLSLVLEEFRKRWHLDAAQFWIKNFEDADIKCYASSNLENNEIVTAGKFFANRVMSKGEPLVIEDLGEQKLLEESKMLRGFKGLTAYPFKTDKKMVAAIVAFSHHRINQNKPLIHLRAGIQDKLASNIKRKKTEEELKKIFDLSPDVLAIVGKDGYFKKFSPSLERILGYSRDELLRTNVKELVHPDDLDNVSKWQASLEEEDGVRIRENRYRTKQGSYRWFSWSVTSFLEKDFVYAVGKDITEHKEQVDHIQLQNQRLSEIAWEQSHVVRAPLARLLACVAHLKENIQDLEIMLDAIANSALELDTIVKTIVSKTERISEEEDLLKVKGKAK